MRAGIWQYRDVVIDHSHEMDNRYEIDKDHKVIDREDPVFVALSVQKGQNKHDRHTEDQQNGHRDILDPHSLGLWHQVEEEILDLNLGDWTVVIEHQVSSDDSEGVNVQK